MPAERRKNPEHTALLALSLLLPPILRGLEKDGQQRRICRNRPRGEGARITI
ncbi:hypothetical protein [Oscillibacter sp.]|uniref:hypothetical protein n=1 Tax=Oscillibacter sp. TaxID=1945593 RepID=UPI0028A1845D|nr:hypothetical protein [Oscillibacter sp.]